MMQDSDVVENTGIGVALPRGLPQDLPQLRTLVLNSFTTPRSSLAALTARNAPNLRVLHVQTMEGARCCPLRSTPELCALVQRNPLLHVLYINADACAATSALDRCDRFERGVVRLGDPAIKTNLFGHHPAELCGVQEHCSAAGVWLYVTPCQPPTIHVSAPFH